MMRRLLLPLFLTAALIGAPMLAISQPAYAQNDVVTEELCQDDAVSCDTSLFGEDGLILNIANILIRVVAGVAVIVIVIAGLMYILSGGDSNSVQRAKNALLYAVVGLAVALAAQAVVSFVLNTAS